MTRLNRFGVFLLTTCMACPATAGQADQQRDSRQQNATGPATTTQAKETGGQEAPASNPARSGRNTTQVSPPPQPPPHDYLQDIAAAATGVRLALNDLARENKKQADESQSTQQILGYILATHIALAVMALLALALAGFSLWRTTRRTPGGSRQAPEATDQGDRGPAAQPEAIAGLLPQLREMARAQASTVADSDWEGLAARKQNLVDFSHALEGLASRMTPADRESFLPLLESEVRQPLARLRDLLALREIDQHPDNSALLLKGALLGDELLRPSAIQALLRRTQPDHLLRSFLPEVDRRLSEKRPDLAKEVLESLSPVCPPHLRLLDARAGEALDLTRHQIASTEVSEGTTRNKILRYQGHGIFNEKSGNVELKTKVVVAG